MKVIEILSMIDDPSKRGEVADYINNHESEYSKLIDAAFSQSADGMEETRRRLLDLVDLLNQRIATEIIEHAIFDTDANIRIRGLKAAYRNMVDILNEELLCILDDRKSDFEARKWIVHILATTDSETFGRRLRSLARNHDEGIEIRKEAIFALTNVADDESLGTLCAVLGDSEVEIRRSGAWALSKLGDNSTINCLFAALEDEDSKVRDWAIRALRDMDDARALQGLADALHSVEPEEQIRMIRLVVEKRSEIILRAIAELLSSPDTEVRRVAAWAMGVSPYPPAAGSLEALSDDEDEQTRYYAKAALRRLGSVDPSDFGLVL
ncbi:hypothetical protein EU538_00960 [Candidatus Thorarchaeota archaeon]|jgi:hypothetical protein|nr:MAG: hypothetical protein EU538_00960 [Candidatus Thorarchaeota archaeon]